MLRRWMVNLLVAALGCSSTGCLSMYSTRPVEIVATNAKTGQPVANLTVQVDYSNQLLLLNCPIKANGVTDEKGRTYISIADFEAGISVYAAGYESHIDPEVVRNGGSVTLKPETRDTDNGLKVKLQLFPQPSSLFQRFFGWVPIGDPMPGSLSRK